MPCAPSWRRLVLVSPKSCCCCCCSCSGQSRLRAESFVVIESGEQLIGSGRPSLAPPCPGSPSSCGGPDLGSRSTNVSGAVLGAVPGQAVTNARDAALRYRARQVCSSREQAWATKGGRGGRGRRRRRGTRRRRGGWKKRGRQTVCQGVGVQRCSGGKPETHSRPWYIISSLVLILFREHNTTQAILVRGHTTVSYQRHNFRIPLLFPLSATQVCEYFPCLFITEQGGFLILKLQANRLPQGSPDPRHGSQPHLTWWDLFPAN